MTQEDKQLLLKGICEKLPYGIKGLHRGKVHVLFTIDGREANSACIQVDGYDAWFPIETFKPYLRPMSSMTEEEEYEYDNLITYECNDEEGICFSINNFDKLLDWFNRKMFDYRGLIPMGLALEAPEGMYKI